MTAPRHAPPAGRPLRVCFVSQECPPDTGWGGIGSYTYEMARALARLGHQVEVISRAIDIETTRDQEGVRVHRVLPAPDWNRVPGMWRLNGVWPGFAWAAMRRLRGLHAASPLDLVEAAENRADGILIARLGRRPRLIVRLHTPWIVVDRLNRIVPDRKRRLMYWLEKRAILSADALTSPSHAMVSRARIWAPLAEKRVTVVPNPVDTITFSPGEERRGREVLFVGRLEPRKGLGTLVDVVPAVLKRCPDASFRFAGRDGVDPEGRSWRARLLAAVPEGDRHRVDFDWVPRQALPELYRRSALCVVPSLWENCPYALLEAMACGTPVVASRTGGLPELVRDGCEGCLVAPEDGPALADAIVGLLTDETRRLQMGRNARRRVESEFSVETVAPRMVEVYRSTLGPAP